MSLCELMSQKMRWRWLSTRCSPSFLLEQSKTRKGKKEASEENHHMQRFFLQTKDVTKRGRKVGKGNTTSAKGGYVGRKLGEVVDMERRVMAVAWAGGHDGGSWGKEGGCVRMDMGIHVHGM